MAENDNDGDLLNDEQSAGAGQQADGPAPKRGRPPKAKEVSEQVTYRPGPEGPASIKWRGHTFHANVPKTITSAEHIEAARLNRFFKVGDFGAADAVPSRDEVPLPKTSDQYRAHVVAWMPKMSSAAEMDAKWISEEPLRLACGVGSDDLEWLQSLMAPKHAELRKAAMAV